MQWSYGEANSVSDATGSLKSSLERIIAVCQRESRIPQAGSAHLGSAAALPVPDKHFDAVVIDPP
ncbi:hypothetical protein HRbin36_01842 [bacterium HR36]|nr:hypothetical protein HRbin36_01842 [bacterium HR36]